MHRPASWCCLGSTLLPPVPSAAAGRCCRRLPPTSSMCQPGAPVSDMRQVAMAACISSKSDSAAGGCRKQGKWGELVCMPHAARRVVWCGRQQQAVTVPAMQHVVPLPCLGACPATNCTKGKRQGNNRPNRGTKAKHLCPPAGPGGGPGQSAARTGVAASQASGSVRTATPAAGLWCPACRAQRLSPAAIVPLAHHLPSPHTPDWR